MIRNVDKAREYDFLNQMIFKGIFAEALSITIIVQGKQQMGNIQLYD